MTGVWTIETTSETVNQIRDLRSANNVLWMRLLEIAIEHAPDEAKNVLRGINANDRAVSTLLAELAK